VGKIGGDNMKNLKEIEDYGSYTIFEKEIQNNIPRQLGKTISVMIEIENSLIIEYRQRLLRLISVAEHRRKRGYKL
jgi:hypothetical protein